MNAAFTIVAKNYFALALTLAESLKEKQPDVDFYILLADETDDLKAFEGSNHILVQAKDIGIADYDHLAFKYNVTEFCTAVKPFFFSYLFKNKNYDKIIYFDPDIYIYHNLDSIYGDLDASDVILTPHFLTPEADYTGNASETLTLFAGIYNLGFVGVKHSADGLLMLAWWEKRLAELCYADKFEALHVDQKWMDFVPALFQNINISRYMGYNIAYWNIHEREFIADGDGYMVTNRINPERQDRLVFAHFSGLNPLDICNNKQCPTIVINDYPDWEPLMAAYAQKVINNNFSKYLSYGYSYSEFDNGNKIAQFQRRLFRSIIESKAMTFGNPFATGSGSFFELMTKNKLVLPDDYAGDKLNERNFEGFDNKLKKLNMVMNLVKKGLGFEKYVLLLKFCQRYFRPENQTFLIKELGMKIKFKNENIKETNKK